VSAIFETDRLIVRPWTLDEADVERVFDTYSRWEVARWLGAQPRALRTRDEAAVAIERWATRSTLDGRGGVWAAQVRSTGVVAGSILLVPLPEPADGSDAEAPGAVEVGWHLHPDSWGHGYATEGARAALEFGFAGGLREIYAVVRPDNERSLAVCRRLGMTPLGLTTRWYDTELEAFRTTAPSDPSGRARG
jgi:RimJ/RimL family protein N-acetyltransferase